jgi:hypothetical protein
MTLLKSVRWSDKAMTQTPSNLGEVDVIMAFVLLEIDHNM